MLGGRLLSGWGYRIFGIKGRRVPCFGQTPSLPFSLRKPGTATRQQGAGLEGDALNAMGELTPRLYTDEALVGMMGSGRWRKKGSGRIAECG